MTTETTLNFPPLRHMNGSGYKNLFDQYREVYGAIQTLEDLAHRATPHARDYHISPDPYYYDKAREEYTTHLKQLYAVKAYFESLCLNINEQWGK